MVQTEKARVVIDRQPLQRTVPDVPLDYVLSSILWRPFNSRVEQDKTWLPKGDRFLS